VFFFFHWQISTAQQARMVTPATAPREAPIIKRLLLPSSPSSPPPPPLPFGGLLKTFVETKVGDNVLPTGSGVGNVSTGSRPETGLPSDGPSLFDGMISDGIVEDGVSDGKISEGGVSDGKISEGGVSDGKISEGGVSDGTSPEGGVSDGTSPEGGMFPEAGDSVAEFGDSVGMSSSPGSILMTNPMPLQMTALFSKD